jgi:hypothetical protein
MHRGKLDRYLGVVLEHSVPRYVELWWELVAKRQARKGAPAIDVAVRQLCGAPFGRGTPDEQPEQQFGFAAMKRALWFRKAALSSIVDSLVRPAKKLTDPGEPLLRCLRQVVTKHKASPIVALGEEFGRCLTSSEGRATLIRLGIEEEDIVYLGPVIGVYADEILWLAPTLDEALLHTKDSRTTITLLRRPMQIVMPELPEWVRERRHEIAAMKENEFVETSRLLLRATLPETGDQGQDESPHRKVHLRLTDYILNRDISPRDFIIALPTPVGNRDETTRLHCSV